MMVLVAVSLLEVEYLTTDANGSLWESRGRIVSLWKKKCWGLWNAQKSCLAQETCELKMFGN